MKTRLFQFYPYLSIYKYLTQIFGDTFRKWKYTVCVCVFANFSKWMAHIAFNYYYYYSYVLLAKIRPNNLWMSNECATACCHQSHRTHQTMPTGLLLFFKMSAQISAATDWRRSSRRKWTNIWSGELWTNKIEKTVPTTACVLCSGGGGKVNLIQTFECFFGEVFPVGSCFFFLLMLSPFSAMWHSINVTTTDMQKKKYVCICLYVFFFLLRCFFAEIPTGELCLHSFFFVFKKKKTRRVGELESWRLVAMAQAHQPTRESSSFSANANNLEYIIII